jgi:hypothetical protein
MARVAYRRWKERGYEQTAQQIERWRAEAHRMWLDAYKSILRVKRVQDKLDEHCRIARAYPSRSTVGGRVAKSSMICRPISPPYHLGQATEENSTH